MSETADFVHGTYGDDSGVVFYGPPVHGFRDDQLVVSTRYIRPLFRAIIDRAGERTPRVVAQRNQMTGWAASTGIQELSSSDAMELAAALEDLREADLVSHAGETAVNGEDCMRCASEISRFLRHRVKQAQAVYIESD